MNRAAPIAGTGLCFFKFFGICYLASGIWDVSPKAGRLALFLARSTFSGQKRPKLALLFQLSSYFVFGAWNFRARWQGHWFACARRNREQDARETRRRWLVRPCSEHDSVFCPYPLTIPDSPFTARVLYHIFVYISNKIAKNGDSSPRWHEEPPKESKKHRKCQKHKEKVKK